MICQINWGDILKTDRKLGCIGKNISLLYRKRQMYLNKKLSEYGICSSEYMFIMSMPLKGSVTLTYLSQDVAVDPALTTKVVNKLVDKGFFLKMKSEEDKRAFKVSLTEEGKKIKPIITKILHDWVDSITEGMEEEQVDSMASMLEELVAHIPNK